MTGPAPSDPLSLRDSADAPESATSGSIPSGSLFTQPVAVVGIGACLPHYQTAADLWTALLKGVFRDTDQTDSDIEALIDPASGLSQALLRAARDCLRGVQRPSLSGIILGGPVQDVSPALRLADTLACDGFSCDLGGDHTAALAALSMAAHQLRSHEADLMLCGSSTPRDGAILFALKRLSDAERDHDPLLAVIKGQASGRQTADVLQRAYQAAGYGPDMVELLDSAADAQQAPALSAAFAAGAPRRSGPQQGWVTLGSMGHAARHPLGSALQVLKAVLSLATKALPPALAEARAESALAFQSPAVPRPWVLPPDGPRRAAVAAWSTAALCHHLTLEEYSPDSSPDLLDAVLQESLPASVDRAPVARPDGRPLDVLALSAASPNTLREQVKALRQQLASTPHGWRSLCRHSHAAFDASLSCKAVLLVASGEPLASQLETLHNHLADHPAQALKNHGSLLYSPQALPLDSDSLAFLFPGQNSQYPEMGAGIALHHPAALAVWDDASPQVCEESGDGQLTLRDVVFPPCRPSDDGAARWQDRLDAPDWAQPALGVASLATLAALESLGLYAGHMAGQDCGELTALAAAGAVPREALEPIARTRGQLIAQALSQTPQPVLVVDGDAETVRDALELCDLPAGAAAPELTEQDSPPAILLTADADLLETIAEQFRALGLECAWEPLNAHHALHQAGEAFRDALQPLVLHLPSDSPCLVWSAARTTCYDDSMDLADSLGQHVAAPGEMAALIRAHYNAGVRVFVDIGPGNGLARLVSETLDGLPHHAIALDQPQAVGDGGWHAFLNGIAHLIIAGATVSLSGLDEELLPPDEGREPCAFALVEPEPEAEAEPEAEPNVEPEPDTEAGVEPETDIIPVAESQEEEEEEEAPAEPQTPPPPAHTPLPADAFSGLSPAAAHAYGLYQQAVLDAHRNWQEQMAQAHLAMLASLDRGLAIAASAPPSEPLADQQPAEPTAPFLDDEAEPLPETTVQQEAEPEADEASTLEISPEALEDAPLSAPVQPRLAINVASSIPRQTLTLVDEPASGDPCLPPQDQGLTVALIDDQTGVAPILAGLLREAGHRVDVNNDQPQSELLGAIVDLSGLRPLATVRSAADLASAAFQRAQACHDRLSAVDGAAYIAVFDNGGGHGLSAEPFPLAPWRAALGALAKGVRHEWPLATVKSIDIATTGLSAAEIAQRLASEILTGGHQVEIALPLTGERFVPRLNRTPPPQTPSLDVSGLVVVSGGGHGITAQCVLALAQYCPGPYLLLGRSLLQDESPLTTGCPDAASLRALLLRRAQGNGKLPTPSSIDRQVHAIMTARAIRETLAVLHDHGITARYANVDVRDREALAIVLDQARADFGPVQAIIHGAGLRPSRPLPDKSITQFEAVFGTKALALHTLLSLTSEDPLRLIATFSSVVARSGQAGELDYGMGCEVLNKLAWAEQRRRGDGCRVVSINWGDWEKASDERDPLAQSTSHALPQQEGAGLFVRETLSGADGAVEVNYGDGFVLP